MRMMFDLDLLKTCSLLPNVRFPPIADLGLDSASPGRLAYRACGSEKLR
jgi:hypothetical protein